MTSDKTAYPTLRSRPKTGCPIFAAHFAAKVGIRAQARTAPAQACPATPRCCCRA